METIHHAIMSRNWLRKQGLSDNDISQVLLWSMMPDILPALCGYSRRAETHLEDMSTAGSQLHATSRDMSPVYTTDIISLIEDAFANAGYSIAPPVSPCAVRIGWLLHLLQDRAYDQWILKFVKWDRTDESHQRDRSGRKIEGARRAASKQHAKTMRYRNASTGALLEEKDVSRLKRWSWRRGYETMSGVSAGEAISRSAADIEEVIFSIRQDRSYLPEMERALFFLWNDIDEQTALPAAFRFQSSEMERELFYAWAAWEKYLLQIR